MRFPVFDGHADTAMENFFKYGQCLTQDVGHINFANIEKLGKYAQFFAFCSVCFRKPDPVELFEKAFAKFMDELQQYGEKFALCGNVQQLKSAWEQKKTAAFLAIEGAEAIGCDPGRLEDVYARGVRMITLTWNFENALGGTCKTGGGLTEQGREFVRRAQELGMIVDISHSSDAVFFDVCEIATKPIIASHSNCRAVCDHPRNLTDDQLRCVRQLGGTVGINLYPPFLRGETASFEDVRRHMEHMLEIAGEDIVALGGDLDGIDSAPEGFAGVADYETITGYLAANGFSDALLEKICSENLVGVMERCQLKPV